MRSAIETNMKKEYMNGEELREWTVQETIADGETGNAHIIPPACSLGVNLIVGAGSGKLQYTRSPRKTIRDSISDVNWIDWEDGTVTGDTGRTSIASVTGIRAVSVSGDITLEAVASSR